MEVVVEVVEPLPYKGAMGLFDVPRAVVDSLREKAA